MAALPLFAPASWAGPLSAATAEDVGRAATATNGLPKTMGTVNVAPDFGLPPSPATGQRGVQVRTNLLSGPSLQAGPTVEYLPEIRHSQVSAIAAGQDSPGPVELGGFVGYLFHDGATGRPTSSLGIDLQVAADPAGASGSWLVQPGLDFSTPIAPALQFSTRLFSTYAQDGYGGNQFGLERSRAPRTGNADLNFQDVGVGVGLGYSITDNWNVQTEARYQRSLGYGEPDSQNVNPAHQFFGGVMLDYKF